MKNEPSYPEQEVYSRLAAGEYLKGDVLIVSMFLVLHVPGLFTVKESIAVPSDYVIRMARTLVKGGQL